MSETVDAFEYAKLGEHAEILAGPPFNSAAFTEKPEDIPLVKGENVQQGYVDWNIAKRWPVNDADSYKRFWLVTGDVVVAMDRPWVTAGLKWAYIKRNDPPALLVQRVARVRGKKTLDQGFLRCLISSAYFSNYIQPIVTGVNVPHISGKQIGDFRIPVLPLQTQQKIAAVLSAYDDLIANNQRRITLLERMAEDIYREWFVRLRFPGHRQVKIERGVPKGWTVRKFRDVVQHYIGGGWGEETQTATHSESAYVIRGTDIPGLNDGDVQIRSHRFHTPSNLKSRLLRAGDLVFEVSGGSKDQLLGRNLLATEKLLSAHDNRVICASFCKMLRFNTVLVSPYVMKYFFKLYYETDLVGLYQVQSTGISNYQFEAFLNYQTVLVPTLEMQNKFDAMVKPILELKDDIALQTVILRQTRDALLPPPDLRQAGRGRAGHPLSAGHGNLTG
ncbi:restriction endonuclease subunit S [Polaromonas sp. P2-4]|nr:restriction endonuclease subunit S [Polaromonas sp. P2-4]